MGKWFSVFLYIITGILIVFIVAGIFYQNNISFRSSIDNSPLLSPLANKAGAASATSVSASSDTETTLGIGTNQQENGEPQVVDCSYVIKLKGDPITTSTTDSVIRKQEIAEQHQKVKEAITMRFGNVNSAGSQQDSDSQAGSLTGNVIDSIEKTGINSLNPIKSPRYVDDKKKAMPYADENNLPCSDRSLQFSFDYDTSFNGLSVSGISPDEAESLKNLEDVDNVYPDHIVKSNLMDAVPFINADDVWKLNSNLNLCPTNSSSCLTGKNVKIAVLDTGVDYTHQDLGGSGSDEISLISYPVRVFNGHDRDGNYIAFGGEKGASYYNLDTNSLSLIRGFSGNDTDINYPSDPKISYPYVVYWHNHWYKDPPSWNHITLNSVNVETNRTETVTSYGLIYDSQGQTQGYNDGPYTISKDYIIYTKIFLDNATSRFSAHFYSYNVRTNKTFQISGISGYYLNPALTFKVSYPWIIYQDYIQDSDEYEIRAHNIETQETKSIVRSHRNRIEDLNGDFLLYKDHQSLYNLPGDLFVYSLSSGQSTQVDTGSRKVFTGRVAKDGKIIFSDKQNYLFLKDGNQIKALLRQAWDISLENNLFVFIKGDSLLRTHAYSASNSYPSDFPIRFKNKIVGGYDFVGTTLWNGYYGLPDDDPFDGHGHGTHVSSIAAGSGALNGVAPGAQILAYKVLSDGGSGSWSVILAGIDKAVDPNGDGNLSDKADVISMSLGADCVYYNQYYYNQNYTDYCGPNDPQSTALDNAASAGVVPVVAAGNSGPNKPSIGSPGTSRKAITVGATYKWDSITYFSSRGPVILANGENIQKPDIIAPGAYICAAKSLIEPYWQSFCLDSNHMSASGTSMATPMVAGVVALIKQARPSLTPSEVKTILKSSAIKIGGYDYDIQGSGRVDALAAVLATSPPNLTKDLFLRYAFNQSYKYDTVPGTHFPDLSKYGNDGHCSGVYEGSCPNMTLSFARPKSGGGYDYGVLNFTNSTNIIRSGPSPTLHMSPDMTISAWIYPRLLSENFGLVVGKINGVVDCPAGDSLCSDREYFLAINKSGMVQFQVTPVSRIGVGAINCQTPSGVAPLNKWTHIVAQISSSEQSMKIFANGIQIINCAPIVSLSSGIRTSTGPLSVGRMTQTSWGALMPFNGYIDDVRLYNRTLTQAEIQALMKE